MAAEYTPIKDGLHIHERRTELSTILSSESFQRRSFVTEELKNTLPEFLEYYKSFLEAVNRLSPYEKQKWFRCISNLEETKKLLEAGDPNYKLYYEWHLYENWDLCPYNH